MDFRTAFDPLRAFGVALRLFRRAPLTLLVGGMLLALTNGPRSVLQGSFEGENVSFEIGLGILLLPLHVLLRIGYAGALQRVLVTGEERFRDLFQHRGLYWRMAGAMVLQWGVQVLIALPFLVLLGGPVVLGEEFDLDGVGWLVGGLFSLAYLPIWAYVALGFLLVPYVVSIESLRPVASLRRSWELSEPHRMNLLGMWFVGFLVELAWVAVSLVFLLATCCIGLPLVLLLSLFPAAWIEAAWYEAMLRHVLPPPDEGLWADREEEAKTRPTGPAGAGPAVEVAEDGR